MTEEQREKLEELISEFEYYCTLPYAYDKKGDECSRMEWELVALQRVNAARDRITNHLNLIQWNAALYNFQRFGVKDLDDLDLIEWVEENPSPTIKKWGRMK